MKNTTHSTALAQLLYDMNKYNLLTEQEETELGKTIALAYQNGALRENATEIEIHRADRACQTMVKHNLRLVVSIAKKYQTANIELADLIQEGAFGCIRAAQKFDTSKGYKFSTYAYWWIRQAITKAIQQKGRMIRIPAYQVENISKLRVVSRELQLELGRIPTRSELADRMGKTIESVDNLLILSSAHFSLNKKNEEGTLEWIDTIASTDSLPHSIDHELLRDRVSSILGNIKESDRTLIALRFGLSGNKAMSLREISAELQQPLSSVRSRYSILMRSLRREGTKSLLKDWAN